MSFVWYKIEFDPPLSIDGNAPPRGDVALRRPQLVGPTSGGPDAGLIGGEAAFGPATFADALLGIVERIEEADEFIAVEDQMRTVAADVGQGETENANAILRADGEIDRTQMTNGYGGHNIAPPEDGGIL